MDPDEANRNALKMMSSLDQVFFLKNNYGQNIAFREDSVIRVKTLGIDV